MLSMVALTRVFSYCEQHGLNSHRCVTRMMRCLSAFLFVYITAVYFIADVHFGRLSRFPGSNNHTTLFVCTFMVAVVSLHNVTIWYPA